MNIMSFILGVGCGVKSATPTPFILTQPEDQTGAIDSYATFAVTTDDDTNNIFQWISKAPTSDKWVITSFTSSKTPTLSVKITAARDGYTYKCVVVNAATGEAQVSDGAVLHAE